MENKLEITNNAQKHIASVIASSNSKYFRITVLGGGCAGFQYKYDFDNQKNDDDIILEEKKITVIIDTTSLNLIKGSKIDYVNELINLNLNSLFYQNSDFLYLREQYESSYHQNDISILEYQDIHYYPNLQQQFLYFQNCLYC